MKRIIVLVLILSIPSSGISQQLASNSRLLVNEQLSLKDGISLTSASFAKVPSPMEFEEFLDEYKMTKKFYEMEANVLGFGTYTSKTVVSVGIGATSLLGVPPPIAALGGVVAADAIQMLGDKIESQLFSALNAQFENGLLLYRATHSQREIEMLTGQSTEEVYRAVYGSSKIFSLQNEFELKDQEKEDYQKFVLQVLADKVAKIEWSEFARNKETRDLGLEIADLEMEISKNGKKLKGLTRLYREFVVGTYSHISQVDKNTVEVLKDTRELILRSQNLSADIQQNRDQVEFIQEFFYGKMTSEEQLKALERGWLPSLQGADRSKSIEMLQKRSQIEEIWGNVDKAFSALPLLARTLRLDPETIQGIDKSSMLVRSGISIASSLASQNYFSAAMSFLGLVGGLFGPKHDPDKPARMRHDQIMRAFGTVIENQELIYSGIKSLAEGQKQIFEVQKATFEGLVKVSRQITELHLDMQKRLNGIKAYEVRNIELARSLLLQDVSSCFGFLKKSEGDLGKTLLVSKLKGLDQLTQHFRFY
ncbi:MAG: hypothetical protein KDD35_09535, partial [Bdellovibrionales bacterium]|nr:hypothetical protein [Bdellovibrionales bacterium]